MQNKIATKLDLQKEIFAQKIRGRKIVFARGCFDVLHPGHLLYLEEAKRAGDFLVVFVNNDASVRALKGRARPIFKIQDRMRMLAALSTVDLVISFRGEQGLEMIKKYEPEVVAVSKVTAQYKAEIESYGGKIVLIKKRGAYSTTNILKKFVKKNYDKAKEC